MSETSRFWNTNDVGDGPAAGYASELITAWLSQIFGREESGIIARVLNELEVSGAVSPLKVESGAAIVDGHFYLNDVALNLTVSTPNVGTTGGLVVLRMNSATQTVRAVVLLNDDGDPDPPDPTQVSGTLYELPLASFKIETGGDIVALETVQARISFADSPQASRFIAPGLSVLGKAQSGSGAGEAITAGGDDLALRRKGTEIGFGQIETSGIVDGAVNATKLAGELELATSKFDDGAVGVDQIAADAVNDAKAGNRVPQFYRRQGGSESDWNGPGVSNYIPGAVRMLAGSISVIITSGYGASVDVTLPVALKKPLIQATVMSVSPQTTDRFFDAEGIVLSDTSIRIIVRRDSSWITDYTVAVAWLVIGPEG